MNTPTVESVATLAGRELDTAVSRALFPFRTMWCPKHGVVWEPVHIKDGHCIDGGGCGLAVQERTDNIPHYSTDPAAFFALMEKVRENGWRVNMYELYDDEGRYWCVKFTTKPGVEMIDASGSTLPLAFARAALLTTITPKGG